MCVCVRACMRACVRACMGTYVWGYRLEFGMRVCDMLALSPASSGHPRPSG